MKFTYSMFLAVLLIVGCQPPETQQHSTQPTPIDENQLDQGALAQVIGSRMDLKTGEKVLLVAKPGTFNDLVKHLENIIKSAGATYLGTVSVDGSAPESWRTDFTKEFLAKESLEALQEVDLGIMLPGATPNHKVYELFQDKLGTGTGRGIHFHWAGAYDLNGNLLPLDEAKEQFYLRVLQDTDYARLTQNQMAFEEAMRDQTIRVTTPAGTDISFSIGDRPVTKQDGDASARRAAQAQNLIDREVELPAGAIRVAPMEESVAGTIAFPDSDWGGTRVEGLVMTFEGGIVTELTAALGEEELMKYLENEGLSARSFREFALGLNPLMTVQTGDNPWIPYYGYGSGIVRLSLGDNQELGGNVGGGFVRWNFFTDATVYVGDSLWVEAGKLVR